MVSVVLFLTFSLGPIAVDEPTDPMRSALGKGTYPWYDEKKDEARPLTPPSPPRLTQVRQGPGSFELRTGDIVSLVIFILIAVALIGLFIFVAKWWRYYVEGLDPNPRPKSAPAVGRRVVALPTGLSVETDDPWAEARARRARGDLSGAIVCVFVHLLLRLDSRGLVRLAPGRTGRQLVRAIGPDDVREGVEPTLRLFEAAYYGHREPSPEAFEHAWGEAEALEGRWAAEVQS